MKSKDRDELLGRLDERTQNIWRVTEQQEKHLAKQNGHIESLIERVATVETKVDERTTAKLGRKTILGISGGGILLLATLIFTALQLFS